MIGMSGAAANVETTKQKKDIHPRWKARMCGLPKEKILMDLALCSESTGREKWAGADVESVEPTSIAISSSLEDRRLLLP